MKYVDVVTAAEKWGLTPRRVRVLCTDGRIDGAVKNGWSWIIPEDAPRPRDGRMLRRFRNYQIRPGVVDVDNLEEKKKEFPLTLDIKKNPKFVSMVSQIMSILFSLDGHSLRFEQIKSVLGGKISPSLSLSEHLIIVNFYSIFTSLITKKEKWTERELREVYTRLMQGIIKDEIDYRDGFVKVVDDEDDIKVSTALESILMQYENTWSRLYGLSSAVILSGELIKIAPFDTFNITFSFLVLSGELFRSGLLFPYLDSSIIDEARASFSLVRSRGVYTNVSDLIERLVNRSYLEMEKDV